MALLLLLCVLLLLMVTGRCWRSHERLSHGFFSRIHDYDWRILLPYLPDALDGIGITLVHLESAGRDVYF